MLFHRHRGERVSRSFSELCEPASIHGPVCILEVYTSEKESEKERERERECVAYSSAHGVVISTKLVSGPERTKASAGAVQLARSTALAASSDVERL